MNIKEKKADASKAMWLSPWSYKEAFAIAFGLFITSLLIELFSTKAMKVVWPANAIVLAIVLLVIIFVGIKYSENSIVKWFSSIPAAVASITYFTLLVLIMALIPQSSNAAYVLSGNTITGTITKLIGSWPFILAVIYLLLSLGFVTLKRIRKAAYSDIGFILNHLGLWITIAAAALGSGDRHSYRMKLQENKTVFYAHEKNSKKEFVLPFAIELKKFHLNTYNPKLVILENAKVSRKGITELRQGKEEILHNWKISVLKYIPFASPVQKKYIAFPNPGSVPAAYLKLVHIKTKQSLQGWVGGGSYINTHKVIALGNGKEIGISVPEAKNFRADVLLYTKKDIEDSFNNKTKNKIKNKQYNQYSIRVNEPLSVNDWKIYLVDYDKEKGRWSDTVQLEVSKDPWLPLVYTGLLMLVLGSFYLIIMGKKNKAENISESGA